MARFVVTGAFGYSGRSIARRLLDQGHQVHTVTNSPDRENPFQDRVTISRFHFDRPELLAAVLAGADALINTYWVRFDHRDFTHAGAVANTRVLFAAARAAGVPRVVHVSITNPSLDSDLPYFRGKAELERDLMASGLSYAILRPAVLFGGEDVLVNNIAWALRRFPVFGLFGDGAYRLQPIHVDDFAALAVARAHSADNGIVDAIGPDTFTYRELVAGIGEAIGVRRPLVSIPAGLGHAAASLIGRAVGDVLLTREEITGLMRGLLVTGSPPAGSTRLLDWARAHRETVGTAYASELARRRNRRASYASLTRSG